MYYDHHQPEQTAISALTTIAQSSGAYANERIAAAVALLEHVRYKQSYGALVDKIAEREQSEHAAVKDRLVAERTELVGKLRALAGSWRALDRTAMDFAATELEELLPEP